MATSANAAVAPGGDATSVGTYDRDILDPQLVAMAAVQQEAFVNVSSASGDNGDEEDE